MVLLHSYRKSVVDISKVKTSNKSKANKNTMSKIEKTDEVVQDEIAPVVDEALPVEESEEETEEVETPEEDIIEDKSDETYEVKAVYDSKEKIAVASTNVVDRHGERINQDGWDLKNFKNNPVMLWAHDHKEIAVGVCKNVHIERTGGTPRLVFTPDFHDKTPTAKALKELFNEGWLNSFSVGFIPKEFDGKDSTYLKQELLEISAVNVPANADARMMAFKSLIGKGFKDETAQAVTGIEELPETKAVIKPKAVEKGAVADELDEEAMWEQKCKVMRDAQDVWWAFTSVFYDQDTTPDQFTELLTETIGILQTVADGNYVEPDDGDEQNETVEDSAVVDNNKAMQDSIDKLNAQVESLVKAQENKETSAAPKALPKEVRAKQSLSKVIARASENLSRDDRLSPDSKQMTKIIKRAADILNGANKKD